MAISVAVSGCKTTPFTHSSAPNMDRDLKLTELGKRLDDVRDQLKDVELCLADPRTTSEPGQADGDPHVLSCELPTPAPAPSASSLPPPEAATTNTVDVRDATATNFGAYVRLRKTQIDGLCGIFFDDLSQTKNQTRYGRDLFNIASEFATVALGASGTAAEQLAVISGVQLSVNDAFDATERAMLLSPDPHKVYLLVRLAQAAVSQPRFLNFSEAETYVRDYARPCTFIGIQTVIDKALGEQIRLNAPGGRVEEVNAVVDEVVKVVNRAPGGDITTLAGQALPLYWLFVLAPAQDSAEQTYAIELLPTDVRAAVKEALTNSALRAEIQTLMRDLDTRAASVGVGARDLQTRYVQEQARLREENAERARLAAEADAEAARTETARQNVLAATQNRLAVEARTAELEKQRQATEAQTALEQQREATARATADAARTAVTTPLPPTNSSSGAQCDAAGLKPDGTPCEPNQ